MNNYVCEKCNKIFPRKKNLTYHVNNGVCINKNYNCKYCNNTFSAKSSMYRHMRNNFAVKKQQEKEKKDIYDRL